jgi:tRNA nucleotidyltransferase (CCA-adding enzyme)
MCNANSRNNRSNININNRNSSSNDNDGDWCWPTTHSTRKRYTLGLRPTAEEKSATRSALMKVVYVCHQAVQDVDVDRVVTCGSVGKGTSATVRSDLDLVVYVDGLQPSPNMRHDISAILYSIRVAMDRQYPGTRDTDWYEKYSLHYQIENMEIDILVGAVDVVPMDFLDVSDIEQRDFMSASVSHLSKKFMAKQNLMFKDMVRVVKDWRDGIAWESSSCKPKSYLLELLLLHAFCQFKLCSKARGQTFPLATMPPYWWETRVLQYFFQMIAEIPPYRPQQQIYHQHHLPSLFVCFEPYYDVSDVPLHQRTPIFQKTIHHRHQNSSQTIQATAIVMDPVNPTNNVWLTLNDSGTQFVREAQRAGQQFSS